MQRFPELDVDAIAPTRNALHAYSQVLGDWLKSVRPIRKHWWHASLRPSLSGLSTGVVHVADVAFEIELDFVSGRLHVRTPGRCDSLDLNGQPANDVASWVDKALVGGGASMTLAPRDRGDRPYAGYDAVQAATLHAAFTAIASAMRSFRAGIREETSPIQVWPHHFDLSMLWLPGTRVEGQDPANEEYADKQMNFGFVFGDEGIDEPYLYVTAYPLPEDLPGTELPAGTAWKSDGFSGAVLLYRDLAGMADPHGYLQDVWSTLLKAGQPGLAAGS